MNEELYEPHNLQCPNCLAMLNEEEIIMRILSEPQNGDIVTCLECKLEWSCTPLIRMELI